MPIAANKFFNNSGPVNQFDHFCVSPIKRLDPNKVWQLILQKKYFLICGPKQCGKTSYLLALAMMINRNGHAKCLYFNVESLRGTEGDLEESIRSIMFEISSRARDNFGDDYLDDLVAGILEKRGPYQALNELLTQWSKRSDKPIVLLVDELDTLNGSVLTSVLSQIRAGYDKRPNLFPQSIIFCATHDVIHKQFNIKDATLKISFLHREGLDDMFADYGARTGIKIEKEAVDQIWRYSSGQPWIVSALAGELFHEIAPSKGKKVIGPDQVTEAIDNILAKRGNHIEYIAAQLQVDKVKRCLIPLLTGGAGLEELADGDLTYVQEVGLVTIDGEVEISNGLYADMIPRSLYTPVSYMINLDSRDFSRKDQGIDAVKLLSTFQAFFRNHIDRLVKLVDYGEAGHVLVFHALLQKMVDFQTSVSRDFSLSKNRVVFHLKRTDPKEQDLCFYVKQAHISLLDSYKGLAVQAADEAAEYLAANPGFSGEMHVIFINSNSDFDWVYRIRSAKRGNPNSPVYLWGF
jgi:hypothetical protein